MKLNLSVSYMVTVMLGLCILGLWNRICNQLRRSFFPLLLRYATHLRLNRVYHLTSFTVVKSAKPKSAFWEAEALQFVRQHTSIPVPKVYDLWQVGKRAYVAMEYIDGDRLDRKWESLTEDQKAAVKRILCGYIDQLRAVRQPFNASGWIGSINGQESQDFRTGDAFFGPFKTVGEYHDWRIATFSWFGEKHAPTARRLAELRQTMRDDYRVMLTHGDIHRRNVLIKVDGDGPESVRVVGVLDWEQCGWRPEYWEVVKIAFGPQGDDWQGFYPGYEEQLAIEDELLFISGPPR